MLYLQVQSAAHVDVCYGDQDSHSICEDLRLNGLLPDNRHRQLLFYENLFVVSDLSPYFGESQKVGRYVKHLAPFGGTYVLAQVKNDLIAAELILVVL